VAGLDFFDNPCVRNGAGKAACDAAEQALLAAAASAIDEAHDDPTNAIDYRAAYEAARVRLAELIRAQLSCPTLEQFLTPAAESRP
jgi:hypothetical protein